MSGDARVATRSWWGERFSALLDDAGAAAARRVQRGQGLARRGAVSDVRVVPGLLRAVVTEDRATPHEVEVRWAVPTDDQWDAALDTLATELRFAASLLDATLDPELVDALTDAGVPLVPTLDELTSSCPCGERAQPCRHVAALLTVAGPVLERDPDLLLRWRGRDRAALLRRLRPGGATGEPAAALDLGAGLEVARGDLGAITVHPAWHDDPAHLVRHLGLPPGVDDDAPLAGAIERAAATAWRLAAGEGSAVADEELLLAQLRAARVATASALAEVLGRDVEEVRTELDRLFSSGAVLRTGSGERARYRASSV